MTKLIRFIRAVYTCATCGTKFSGPLCPRCN